jgi:hypothetical protein
MQLFLIGYIIMSICEIFTIGWFPLSGTVRIAFTAIHIASIVATLWILLMNAVVGYQILDDGTIASIGLIFGSAAALFVGTGYIALDTGFAFTNYWQDTVTDPNNRAYALYTLYQLVPLIFLVAFFILEAILVLRVLGEVRPMCKCQTANFFNRLRLTNNSYSLPLCRCSPLRHQPDLPIRYQRAHLHRLERCHQRRLLLDLLHPALRRHDLGLLV